MRHTTAQTIRWLSVNDTIQTAEKFQTTPFGIIVEVGAASEVFIPWGRVVEYMGPRGSWAHFHDPSNTN